MTDTELIIGLGAIGCFWWFLKRYGVLGPKRYGAYTEEQFKRLAVHSLAQAQITPEEDDTYDSFLELLVEVAKEVLTDPNPIMKNRVYFQDSIYKYSRLRVLLLTPDEANFLLQHDAISGELKPYLHEIIEKDKKLYKRFKPHHPSTWEVRANFYARCSYAWMDFHDRLRGLIDDVPDSEFLDWRRSALMAACIWSEDSFRESIGLPRLVNLFEASIYASLLLRVNEGHEDPLAVWEEMIEEARKESDSFDRIRLVGCH